MTSILRIFIILLCSQQLHALDSHNNIAAQIDGVRIDYNDHLIISFNKPIQKFDPNHIPISISPSLECFWVWIDDKNLSCQLNDYSEIDEEDIDYTQDNTFQHATLYTIKLKEGLLDINDHAIPAQTISIIHEPPTLENFKIIDWKSPQEPIVSLSFNQQIIHSTLDNKIFLISSSDKIPLLAVTKKELPKNTMKLSGTDTESQFYYRPQSPLLNQHKYHLQIEKGIKGPAGTIGSETYISEEQIHALPKFSLQKYECYSQRSWKPHNGPCYADDTIEVHFSSFIEKDTVYQCKNRYKYKMNTTRNGEYHSSLTLIPEQNTLKRQYNNILQDCIDSFVDEFDRKMIPNNQITIKTEGFRPSIALVTSPKLLSINEKINLEVKSININEYNLFIEEINHEPINVKHTISIDNQPDQKTISSIPLDQWYKNIQSIKAHISLKDTINARDTHHTIPIIIQKSPYQINFKYNVNYAAVQINDIYSAQPIINQKFSLTHDEKTYAGMTDDHGFAQINLTDIATEENLTDFSIEIDKYRDIPATKISKINNYSVYIDEDESIEQNHHEVIENGFVVYGLTDKPVYRPGETVKFKLFLRQKKDTRFKIPDLNTTFKVYASYINSDCWDEYDECHSFYVQEVKKTDSFGGFSDQFTLPSSANNGAYSLNIILKDLDGWNNLNQDTNLQFKVSNFKDSAYKLSISTTVESVKGKQAIPIKATAEYYSGGFVANESGEIAGEIMPVDIDEKFPELSTYTFKSQIDQFHENHFMKYLKYDDQGILHADYIVPENEVDFGYIKLNAGIKPENGEWNYSSDLIIPYHQKDYFIGLKFKTDLKSINRDITLDMIMINHKGTITQSESTKYQIQHMTKHGQWSASKPLTCKKTSINQCVFTLSTTGEYKITSTATIKDNQYHNDITFFVHDSQSLHKDKHNNKINITADKKVYEVGDTAQFTINLPLNHVKAFITTERNSILDFWVKSTHDAQLKFKLKIRDEHAPGFDLSTLILSLNSDDQLTPEKSTSTGQKLEHSSLNIRVKTVKEKPLFSIKVQKNTYRPKEKVNLNIKSRLSSTYTVAVVDQSIIDLVDEKYLYNLNEFAYKKAKHNWQLMDTHQLQKKANQHSKILYHEDTGYLNYHDYDDNDYYGDYEELDSIRVTGSNIRRADLGVYRNEVTGRPISVTSINRATIKNTLPSIGRLTINDIDLRSYFAESAYFNTDVIVAPDSSQTVTFELPDNLTQWRIIVLGTDESGQMEFQQTSITTSKDLELRSTLPLQLTQGDQFTAEYSVVSKTNKKVTINTAAIASQNNKEKSTVEDTFKKVKKLKSQTFSMPIDPVEPSPLKLTSVAKTKKNADGLINKIPVRKAQIQLSESRYGQLNDEKLTLTFKRHSNNTNDDEALLSVKISDSLLPSLDPVYQYMNDYPHQCWEQKTAKAIISAIEVASNKSLSEAQIAQRKLNIETVLKNAQDYQASDGGMTFFGGQESHVNLFLSLNTLENFDFLNKLGYKSPITVREKLINFINENLEIPESNWETHKNLIDLDTNQFNPSLQLLALNFNTELSQETVAQINDYYYQNRNNLSVFTLNQLLQIYNNSPNKLKQLQKAINGNFYTTNKKYTMKSKKTDYWYHMPSTLKDQCNLISQQLQLDDNHIDKNDLIKHINAILDNRNRQGHFGSTLENAYCSKAIYYFSNKYESKNDQAQYSVLMNNDSYPLVNGELHTKIKDQKELSFTINNPNLQQSYYNATLKYLVNAQDINKQSNGFNLERNYFIFKSGQWHKASDFKTGDWVKTVITIHSPIGRKFVAVSNPVPGGWLPTDTNLASNMPVGIRESENPQDNSPAFYERQLNPATTRFYADYLPAGTHHISYYSQVRNAGQYLILPAIVEEMYDDENRATSETREVIISK